MNKTLSNWRIGVHPIFPNETVILNEEGGLVCLIGGDLNESSAKLSKDVAELINAAPKLRDYLDLMFEAYENGTSCYENDGRGAFLGYAIKLSEEDFAGIADLLELLAPRAAKAEGE